MSIVNKLGGGAGVTPGVVWVKKKQRKNSSSSSTSSTIREISSSAVAVPVSEGSNRNAPVGCS